MYDSEKGKEGGREGRGRGREGERREGGRGGGREEGKVMTRFIASLSLTTVISLSSTISPLTYNMAHLIFDGLVSTVESSSEHWFLTWSWFGLRLQTNLEGGGERGEEGEEEGKEEKKERRRGKRRRRGGGMKNGRKRERD